MDIKRLAQGFLIIGLALAIIGCRGPETHIDFPPTNPDEADKWWAKTVDHLDCDFLATLCEVSEIHRQRGTTATGVDFFMGRTMAGFHTYETDIPVPMPAQAVQRARERLKIARAEENPKGWRPASLIWRAGIGCSAAQAEEI